MAVCCSGGMLLLWYGCSGVSDLYEISVFLSRLFLLFFFFQAEDGIRDLVRSRGLGDVYKRQAQVDLVLVLAVAVIA